MSGAVTAAAAAVATVGMGIYSATQQGGISSDAVQLAQNTQGEQQFYNQKLMQLMSNPSSFLTDPVFQSSLDVGLKGADRQLAAGGFLGSGNEQTSLLQYGNSLASGELFQQEQILSADAGVTSATSPGQALGAASGANSAQFNQLGGSLASLGFTLGNPGFGGGTNGFNTLNSGGNLMSMDGYMVNV